MATVLTWISIAARDHGQFARIGSRAAATHGRIEHAYPGLTQAIADPPGSIGIDRAHHRHDMSARSARDDAVRAEDDVLGLRCRFDHRDDAARPARNIDRSRRSARAGRDQRRDLRAVDVVDDQRIAGLQKIARHAAAHRAEANEADCLCHCCPPFVGYSAARKGVGEGCTDVANRLA
jgi:hypothetical protein